MQAAEIFFAENPEALHCYTALGKAKATAEEAEKLIGGVKGVQVLKVDRIEGVVFEKTSDELLERLIEAEGAEAALQQQFEKLKTPDAMDEWKQAQAAVTSHRAYYELQLKKEGKEAKDKAADESEVPVVIDNADTIKHTITEEDLVNNPELADEKINAGDEIEIPAADDNKPEGPTE